MERYGRIARPDPDVAVVPMVFGFVVPTLVPVATVLVLGMAPVTVVVAGLVADKVFEVVPAEASKPPVAAGVVEPIELVCAVWFAVAVPWLFVPPVAAGVVEPIELVCAVWFTVLVPWLLVLPTWPVFSFGLTWVLDVAELALASLELLEWFDFARDRYPYCAPC